MFKGVTRSHQRGATPAPEPVQAAANRRESDKSNKEEDEDGEEVSDYVATRRGTAGFGLGSRAPTPPPDRGSTSEAKPESPRRTGSPPERGKTQEDYRNKDSLRGKRKTTGPRSTVKAAGRESAKAGGRESSRQTVKAAGRESGRQTPAQPSTARSQPSPAPKLLKKQKTGFKVSFNEDPEERTRDVRMIRAAMSHTRQALSTLKEGGEEKTTFQKVAQLVTKNIQKLNFGKKLWEKKAEPDAATQETQQNPAQIADALMNSINNAFDENADQDGDILSDLEKSLKPFRELLQNLEMPDYRTRRQAVGSINPCVMFNDNVEVLEPTVTEEEYMFMVKDISDHVSATEASRQRLLQALEELESLKREMSSVPTYTLRATLIPGDDRHIASQMHLQRKPGLHDINEDQQSALKKKSDSDSDHNGSSSDEEGVEKRASGSARALKPGSILMPARSAPGSRRMSLAITDELIKGSGSRRLSTQKIEFGLGDLNAESRRGSGMPQTESRRGSMMQSGSRRGSFAFHTEQRSASRRTSAIRSSLAPSAAPSGRPSTSMDGRLCPFGGAVRQSHLQKLFDFSAATDFSRPASAMGEEGRSASPRDEEALAKAKKIAVALRGVRNALKDFKQEEEQLKNVITAASQPPSQRSSPRESFVTGSAQDQGQAKRQSVAKLRKKASLVGKLVGKLAAWKPEETFQDRLADVVDDLPEDIRQAVEEEEPDGAELIAACAPDDPPPEGQVFNASLPEEPDTLSETDDFGEDQQTDEKEQEEHALAGFLGRHSVEVQKDGLLEQNRVERRNSLGKILPKPSLSQAIAKTKEQLPKWLTADAMETLEICSEANLKHASPKAASRKTKALHMERASQKKTEERPALPFWLGGGDLSHSPFFEAEAEKSLRNQAPSPRHKEEMRRADSNSRLSMFGRPEPVFAGAGLMQDRQLSSALDIKDFAFRRLGAHEHHDGNELDFGLSIGDLANGPEDSGTSFKMGDWKKKGSTKEMSLAEAEAQLSLNVGRHLDDDLIPKKKKPGLWEQRRGTKLMPLSALSKPNVQELAKQNSADSLDVRSDHPGQDTQPTTFDKVQEEDDLSPHSPYSASSSRSSLSEVLKSPRLQNATESRPKSSEHQPKTLALSPMPNRPLPKLRLRHRLAKPSARTGFANCPTDYFESVSSKEALEEGRPQTAPQLECLRPVEALRLPWTAPTKSVMPRLSTPRRADRTRAPAFANLLSQVAKSMRMDVISDEFNPLAKLCRERGNAKRGNTGGLHKTHLALMAKAGGSFASGAALATRPATALAAKAISKRGQMELHMWGWEPSELDDDDAVSLVPTIPRVPDLMEVDMEVDDLMSRVSPWAKWCSYMMMAEGGENEYTVSLDRTRGAKIGIGVEHGGENVLIESIEDQGLVSEWNMRHPHQKVIPGDRVLEVNGICSIGRMLDELSKNVVLTVKLYRNSASQSMTKSGSRRQLAEP